MCVKKFLQPMNKTIVVTGVSSFVGCHLANAFSKRGWSVVATISRPRADYQGIQARRLASLSCQESLEVLDITHENDTRDFIAKWKPVVWLHHAGFATDYASYNYDLKKATTVNVEPLFYIYDELQKQKASGVVVTGSSMEYSSTDNLCSEDDACFPAFPYGLSKLTETLAALQLSSKTGLPTRVARLFIPFGPLDSEKKLFSVVLQKLKEKMPIDLSPCTQQRDFSYVEDVVEAYVLLVEDLAKGGGSVFNISSGRPTSLRTLLEIVTHQLKVPHRLLRFGQQPMRPGEAMVSYGSNDKLKNLGWKPRSLEEGVHDFLKGEV